MPRKMTGDANNGFVVEWSEEDQCFIGYWPGVIGPCCHGDDETDVYRRLRRIVDEWLEIENENEHEHQREYSSGQNS